jgi:Family of unknown function (DUF6714)
MIEHVQSANRDNLREQLREAFPSVAFSGPITPVDSSNDEQYEDERQLQGVLRARSWTGVPSAFITTYADSLPLLTREAFAAFLPAWLNCGLVDASVREAVVSVFDKGRAGEPSDFTDNRVKLLTSVQREAVKAVLTYFASFDGPIPLREEIQRCIAYLDSFGS